jgi:hypothetical protein
MTLRDKVAQLSVISFPGTTPGADTVSRLERYAGNCTTAA